ncbi:hypothetical protein FXO38_24827 [Capsicum annuum]|uniref:SF4 helicase domain-containing protein n=1 Tax=Capsicum annuum TaxID=4072 RepID=A0A2G3A502_CAPAN|nr:hypothetical protein FXO37_34216 [Capsicum annuum]KAF3635044.1 hypothetical protein FXO38_24827 [Capsicum annuum]PHT89312.1 hypothetical protein T459_04425 [Capsicum annuum]
MGRKIFQKVEFLVSTLVDPTTTNGGFDSFKIGTETEYVSQMLTKIKRFAQHHSCHVWFVAHPRQLHHWVGGPPNLYDISGSAHFINKCDNGIVIHRNRDPSSGPVDQVQVCVRKVRNKVSGTIGDAFLSYDRVTGEFMDIDEHPRKG